jgi:hypothetical protein
MLIFDTLFSWKCTCRGTIPTLSRPPPAEADFFRNS